jgi:hypothetical protein
VLYAGIREPARDVIEQINLCYGQHKSAGQRDEPSEVFNYLLYELELAARKAAKGGFEILENNVRLPLSFLTNSNHPKQAYALYICAQCRIMPGDSIPRTCLPSFLNLWADAKVKLALKNHHGGRVFGNFSQ